MKTTVDFSTMTNEELVEWYNQTFSLDTQSYDGDYENFLEKYEKQEEEVKKFIAKIKNRPNLDVKPIEVGLPSSKIILRDGALWNPNGVGGSISMVSSFYKYIVKMEDFLKKSSEISSKKMLTYDYIYPQLYIGMRDKIILLDSLEPKPREITEKGVFIYYEIQGQLYPEKNPFQEGHKGYYVIFHRYEKYSGIESISLHNQDDEKIREIKIIEE